MMRTTTIRQPSRRTRAGRAALAAALATALAAGAASEARAAEPRLYLSWRAPEGSPRATRAVHPGCVDTTGHRDTLWLAVDPGRDSTAMLGVKAILAFRPAAGETLSTHWTLGEGVQLHRLRIDFDPDSLPPQSEVWHHGAAGGGYFTRSPHLATLMVIGAISATAPATVRGGRPYVFARILLPHPEVPTENCAQAVCVEWESGSIAYGIGDEPNVTLGERFVTWNASGDPCARWRGAAAPAPWQPGQSPKR
jgi:hypothetical protein